VKFEETVFLFPVYVMMLRQLLVSNGRAITELEITQKETAMDYFK